VPKVALAGVGAALGAAAMAAVGLAPGLWSVGIALSAVAVAGALVLTATTTLVAEIADERGAPAYGSAYALYNLAYAMGLTIAPTLAGLAASRFGFQGATFIGTASIVAVVMACLPAATAHSGT
jgi:MFS family permease